MRRYWYTAILCGSIVITVAVNAFAGWRSPGNETAAGVSGSKVSLVQAEMPAASGTAGTDGAGVVNGGEGDQKEAGRSSTGGERGQGVAMIETGSRSEAASKAGGADQGAAAGGSAAGQEASGNGSSKEQETTKNDGDTSQGTDEAQNGVSIADPDFSGALFIGDSRTVGLSEYGNLGQAKVFANSGMSVYNVLNVEVKFGDEGKKKLEAVLAERSYRTIYLMLGINELGYDYGRTVKQYRSVVNKIKEMEPGAVLVLQANLHVTKDKASKGTVFNNDKINAFNQAVAVIAQEAGCVYLDVNGLFDDPEGNLEAKYSTDGAHVLGKYYSVWSDWLRKKQPV